MKVDPEAVRSVLDALCTDGELYVKKSVANVLRNAGDRHPKFVLDLCRKWARVRNPDTRWIVKDGLRKLRNSQPTEAAAILELLNRSA